MIGDDEWRAEDEALEREMAARAEKLRHDELLQWAHERAAARGTAATVTKDYAPPRAAAPPASATLSSDWQNYIRRQIDASAESVIKDMAKAISLTLGANVAELEKSCATLRDQVRSLELELGELELEMKTRAAVSELSERLERLEARSAPMKVVSGRVPIDKDAMIG